MKIATILFTYNRPLHTGKVLEALKNNTILPDKLFIFHDGMKVNTDSDEWNGVENVSRKVDWCDCEVVTSEYNKGLASSVITGVNRVFEEHDAVIVLEDDCVPHRLFMKYMMQALEKYEKEDNVYSIGATAEPVDVPENGFDAFFVGRINSCGWATWKKKWRLFRRDYRLIGEIITDNDLRGWMQVWGQDLEATLVQDMRGAVDTWAAFWALSVMLQKGLSLSPYYSLVENIGFDGTGRHSGNQGIDNKMLPENIDSIMLPEEVKVIDDYETIFANYYPFTDPASIDRYYKKTLLKWYDYKKAGGSVYDWFEVNQVSSVYLWGLGDVGRRLIGELKDVIKILGIIVSQKNEEEYNGIKIIGAVEVNDVAMDDAWIVVIPGYDIDRIGKILPDETRNRLITVDKLFDPPIPVLSWFGVNSDQLLRYGNEYGGYMLNTDLIGENPIVYSFGIGEDISFDLDILNRHGGEIYAFDPTPKAEKFIQGNDNVASGRIRFYSYGLADECHIARFHLPVNDDYVSGSEIKYNGVKDEYIEAEMRDLTSITKEHGHQRINILKMDIEGSEFKVIDSLDRIDGLIIDQICMETHQRFFEDGMKLIKNMNLKLYQMGYVLIYASSDYIDFTYVRKNLL